LAESVVLGRDATSQCVCRSSLGLGCLEREPGGLGLLGLGLAHGIVTDSQLHCERAECRDFITKPITVGLHVLIQLRHVSELLAYVVVLNRNSPTATSTIIDTAVRS
jgi:hypothetical protein